MAGILQIDFSLGKDLVSRKCSPSALQKLSRYYVKGEAERYSSETPKSTALLWFFAVHLWVSVKQWRNFLLLI
jgi:hypothetical protein